MQSAQELEQIARRFSKLSNGQLPAYLVHACTHFPLINPMFRHYFPGVELIDHADWTGKQVVKYLRAHPTYVPASAPSLFYTTGTSENIKRVQSALFGRHKYVVTQTNIGE